MKKIKLIFIFIILLLLVLPILNFDYESKISNRENRTLAEFPCLYKDNEINFNFFNELNNYINDRFGFRKQLISLNSRLKYDPAEDWHSIEKAVKGKDGWYFYTDGGNYNSYYKKDLLSDKNLDNFDKRVKNIEEFCKSNEIKTFYLIGPNKYSVYEEFYPVERPEGITSTEQKLKVLDNNNISYLYPKDYLISLKKSYNEPFYCETDTHWNSLGAYNVSLLIRDFLNNQFPNVNFPVIEYTKNVYNSYTQGDLLPILNIEKSKSTVVDISTKDGKPYYEYIKNEAYDGIITKSPNRELPKALVFRDSFMVALEPFISPFFSDAEYIWHEYSKADQDYILEYDPDIIIFEFAERYFTKW